MRPVLLTTAIVITLSVQIELLTNEFESKAVSLPVEFSRAYDFRRGRLSDLSHCSSARLLAPQHQFATCSETLPGISCKPYPFGAKLAAGAVLPIGDQVSHWERALTGSRPPA